MCRVVDDPFTGAVRLEVGVGAHDREAFAIIHGDVPTVDALAGVVDAVARAPPARRRRASAQPAGARAAAALVAGRRPVGRSGLVDLVPAPPPQPRTNVKDRVPARRSAAATTATPVVVVCSVGVDLDVIPYATDARLAASGARRRAGRRSAGDGGGDRRRPGADLVAITAELADLRAPCGPARRGRGSGLGRLGCRREASRWPAASGAVVSMAIVALLGRRRRRRR